MSLNSPFQHLSSLPCRICGKPVAIDSANADGDGKAIHDSCYTLKVQLEQASRDGHGVRSWKVIAEEVTHEQDPKKMTELMAELNQALDEQNLDGKPKLQSDGEQKPRRGE